jgi:cell division protein FtsL
MGWLWATVIGQALWIALIAISHHERLASAGRAILLLTKEISSAKDRIQDLESQVRSLERWRRGETN